MCIFRVFCFFPVVVLLRSLSILLFPIRRVGLGVNVCLVIIGFRGELLINSFRTCNGFCESTKVYFF